MKIPIKKYVMDESLSWEERYRQLEKHHEEETEWMIGEIRRLEIPPYARPAAVGSAEIDALIEKGTSFPVRKFYGLEIRGLLGDIIRTVDIQLVDGEKGEYKAFVVMVMRCVESGVSNREVIFEGPIHYTPLDKKSGLTPEQTILSLLLRHLMNHEVEECIRLDGLYIWKPTHFWSERTNIGTL